MLWFLSCGLTCRFTVILALLVLKANRIIITFVFVVTINLSQSVLFFTLTLLTAVLCVPHFVKLESK